jgi:restriction system protein
MKIEEKTMEQPKFDAYMVPILSVMNDGTARTRSQIIDLSAASMKLADDIKNEQVKTGQLRYRNNAGWAITYLNQAGLLDRVKFGTYEINDEGRAVLKENPTGITADYLSKYPQFVAFISKKNDHQGDGKEEAKESDEAETISNPDLDIEKAEATIREKTCGDIIAKIFAIEDVATRATFFEHLVLDVVRALFPGKTKPIHTGKSGDGGIDGIILQDDIGLDGIYIQAKCNSIGNNVGEPEVNQFSGALDRKATSGIRKGILFTTADFSKAAYQAASEIKDKKIILINGEKLAKLMYDLGIGVYAKETITVKAIDEDYFAID